MEEECNTLGYYNSNAKSYFENTIKGDFQENYDRFLNKIPRGAFILDFGCGSGRDSKYFLENGYKVEAIDGSKELCKLASEYIRQDVKCMKFEELNEENIYDGIWACSSILHVTKKEELESVLKEIETNVKIVDYFETVGSTQRSKGTIWTNYIIQKISK